MHKPIVTRTSLIIAVLALAAASKAAPQAAVVPPPNAPAGVSWDAEKGKLNLRYHGATILDAEVVVEDKDGGEVATGIKLDQKETPGEKVEQRLTLTLAEPKEGLTLAVRGTVAGSAEAFPAETLSEAQRRFPYVRNSVGLSRNLRNNAVYDRRWDWVVIGSGDGKTRITPGRNENGNVTFSLHSRNETIELIFRPRFYQKHMDFNHYEPWTYTVWKSSLTGYCTWWAYRHSFTQEVLDAMLKLFVEEHLPDFGYDYMQFDDCYQQGNGSCPENWLDWNKRFPGGWRYAVKVIRGAGMKPGIWVHRVHRPSDPGVKKIIENHPEWFVPGTDGMPHQQHGFCSLNTLNTEAVENMIRPLYRGLSTQGWDYVKIDGTGDLLRAYQNKNCAEFFTSHPTTPEQSLRTWDIVAREELGPDVYILACHTVGNAKHVIGLVNGARLSNDGFQPRTLAQYNFLEGVVWRNDPDHCDVMGTWLMDTDAMMPVFAKKVPVPVRTIIRPAICAMAGSVLMVSDTVEVYEDDLNIEGMKRSAPVLFSVPGQLYSCGRRTVPWWLQEIDRPFDHWSVLARIQWGEKREKEWIFDFKGVPQQEVRFADVGLRDDCEYLVFEFWSQRFLGTFTGSFTAPAMDNNTGMHVFAIREARPHPWILSTTRHLSQGGVSLLDERWDDDRKVLFGKSAVVSDDPYVLTVHLPAGFRLKSVEVKGEKAQVANRKETATVRIVPSATTTVAWTMTFITSGPHAEPVLEKRGTRNWRGAARSRLIPFDVDSSSATPR